MHVADKWQFNSESDIEQFISQYGFATLISPSLQASRLPLYFDKTSNSLVGHFARSNPHWREIEAGQCLAIFDGPHAYISPTWYQSVPAVPTWNYASVHIKGQVKLLTAEQTMPALEQLMLKYQPELVKKRTVVTQAYQERLLQGVVGFAMSIDSIQAQAKLGQHRSIEDQQGVAHGLQQEGSLASQSLLQLMQELKLGLG